MDTFKTPKGTELPFFKVERSKKNKQTGQWEKLPPNDYLEVKYRLIWFREEHKDDYGIETEIVHIRDNMAIVKATIKNAQGQILAQGHKKETVDDFGDFMEKAETSAIGRALAILGYGTQFAQELEEGERLVDSPVPPPAHDKKTRPQPSESPVPIKPVITPPTLTHQDILNHVESIGIQAMALKEAKPDPVEKRRRALMDALKKYNVFEVDASTLLMKKFGTTKAAELTDAQVAEAIETMANQARMGK